MARQSGLFEIEGTIGKATFYKDGNGKFLLRRKSGPSPATFKSYKYDVFRLHQREFGLASAIASWIIKSFGQFKEAVSDGSQFNRLTGLLHAAAWTDFNHPRGERSPMQGNAYLLEGFQWNKKRLLDKVCLMDHTALVDRDTGQWHFEFPPFVPNREIDRPEHATHFQLLLTAACFSAADVAPVLVHIPDKAEPERKFRKPRKEKTALAASPLLRLDEKETPVIDLVIDPPVKPDSLQVCCLDIVFFEYRKGFPRELKKSGAREIIRINMLDGQCRPVLRTEMLDETYRRLDILAASAIHQTYPVTSNEEEKQAWAKAAREDFIAGWLSGIKKFRQG